MYGAVAAVMLGNYYAYDSIGPVAEQLSRELHFSDTQIGTLNAIYSLPNVFLVVIGGVLVETVSLPPQATSAEATPTRPMARIAAIRLIGWSLLLTSVT